MAAPDPLATSAPAEAFRFLGYPSDWKEAIAARHPGGGDNFSGDGDGEACLVASKIPWIKTRGFLREVLGYQYVNIGNGTPTDLGNTTLQRTLPMTHPRWQELICVDAHAEPFRPETVATGQDLPLRKYNAGVSGTGGIRLPTYYGMYRWARITQRFRAVNWDVWDDSQVPAYTQNSDSTYSTPTYSFPSEWTRYTEWNTQPRMEVISLQGGGYTLTFAEGTADAPRGKPFAAPYGQILMKCDLSVKTCRLPEDFLFEKVAGSSIPLSKLIPRNVAAAFGRVNRYPMFSGAYPAGTLLCIGAKLERKRWGLRAGNEHRYLWSCEVMFSYFDPPKGKDSGNVTITTGRGHNNFPWRGKQDANGNPISDVNGFKWFFATRRGSSTTDEANDQWLLPSFDHHQIWAPVQRTLYT